MSRKKAKKKSSNDDAKDIIKGAVGSALGAGLYKAIEYILHMLLKKQTQGGRKSPLMANYNRLIDRLQWTSTR